MITDRAEPVPPAWRSVVPLGLWTAGILAALRATALVATGVERLRSPTDTAAGFLRWQLSGRYLELVVEALVWGILGSALARAAARDRENTSPIVLAVLTVVLFAAFLTGVPLAPEAERASFDALSPLANAALLALFAAVLVGLLFLFARRVERVRPRWLVGARGVALAALLALVVPAALTRATASAPTFAIRAVVADLTVQPELWSTVESHPAVPPAAGVLTPAVSAHTDAADKPALVMPPPCTVEFRIPEGSGPVVFRAAAGIDRGVTGGLGAHGLDALTIDFRIEVGGETRWSETITTRPGAPGAWDPSEWIWHHAGGAEGLVLEPGDVVRLSTALGGESRPLDLPAEMLRVGFGGCVLEREYRRARARATPDSPNLLLVVMDTQRADRMSCYGYPKPTTPNLDALAERGTLFENAYSTSSWTWPSTASILTGLPADAHGVTSNASCTLNLALLTLPEALQWRGYTTAAFSCNPLIAPERYFDQGFESFDYHRSEFRMSDEVVPDVLDWLDANAAARFFLYLHLADPHTPHRPDPGELARLGGERPADWPAKGLDALQTDPGLPRGGVSDGQFAYASDVYDASVATGDLWVGRVLARLRALGLDDRTVVVFTSDHGEELLERGRVGHGHGLHAELVRVPLIIAGPGLARGETEAAVLSNRHIAPTLARLGGTELPGMGDGVFLVEGDLAGDDGAFFQTVKGKWDGSNRAELYGLRVGTDVLHWNASATEEAGALRLFDVLVDPEERIDQALVESELAAVLRARLEERLAAQRAFAPAYVVGVGASGMQTLSGIGYIGGEDDDQDSDEDR